MTTKLENIDESRAKNWLKQQGHIDIQRPRYDPPDFIVDGRYAVEVTRLTRRIENKSGKSKAEENFLESLRGAIEQTLIEMKPCESAKTSWMVYCEYPFSFQQKPKRQQNKITNQVKEQIRSALCPLTKPYDGTVIKQLARKHFNYDRHAHEFEILGDVHFCLECGLCLELRELRHLGNPLDFATKYSNSLNETELSQLRDSLRKFRYGPPQFALLDVSDGQGIALAPELSKSITYCISNKSERVRNQNKIKVFDKWWLVLVDHIGVVPVQILGPDELKLVHNHNPDF